MTYTPDFKIGNVYFEIKGYMDDRSKEKISAFKKSYPNVLLSIITGDEYNILRDTYSDKILWEGK